MYKKSLVVAFILIQILSFTMITPGDKFSVKAENRNSLTSTNWNKYHNYTEIVNILLELNNIYPNIVDVFSVGKSWQNRTIYCLRLTNESITYPKPAILFVGYHHAREPISAELPLYFSVYVAANYGQNATISRILNESEIYVIAALNVDGFNAVAQNEWQRKNAHPFDEDGDGLIDEDLPEDQDGDGRIEYLWDTYTNTFLKWEGWDNDNDGVNGEDWVGGVDLNRNYGFAWNSSAGASTDPASEVYKGPAPFSEPETRALRDLVMQYDFRYAVSFHSGANVILYPWGYTHNPTPDDEKFRQLARNISVLVGSPYEQGSELYLTSGVWDDWMYGNQSVLSLTFELFENDSAWIYEPGPQVGTYWIGGILNAFNPSPSRILETVQRWMPALLYIADQAITHYLPGDVNHDGTVDIYDIVSLAAIYGSHRGDAQWNPKFDLRRDGIIDIFDLVLVCTNFGRQIEN